jgi:hypothetical protein
MRNYKEQPGQHLWRSEVIKMLVTHTRSAILEDLSLRFDILCCGLGDSLLESRRRHCGAIFVKRVMGAG